MNNKNHRFYRNWLNNSHLEKFTVNFKETDLLIRAPQKYPEYCLHIVKKLRNKLDKYIDNNKQFLKSLKPIKLEKNATQPAKKMAASARKVNIGPMAAVAGLFSEKVGKDLLKKTEEVIVENGGDIFLATKKDPIIGIYAGENSPFTGKFAIKISSENIPLGICTSAGTVGPSLSKGKADAVIVISPETTLADAAATALGNMVQTKTDIDKTINYGKKIDNITGLVIIKDDKIGIWGELEIIKNEN